jgi:PAS domain S-box-containing protein
MPTRSRKDIPALLLSASRLALIWLVFFLAVRISVSIPHDAGRLAPIWLASAVGLTALLRSPTRLWPATIVTCITANFAASMLSSVNHPAAALCLALGNGLEYSITALALRRLLGRWIGMDQRRQFVALAIVANLAGLLSGGFVSLGLWSLHGDNPIASMRTWGLAHPMGLLLLTPCFLVLTRGRAYLKERPFTLRAGLSLLLLVGCVLGVFAQSRAPLLFLIPPALLVVTFEFGVFGAAVGVLLTAVIAVVATVLHHGPVSLTQGDAVERATVLQAFLVASLLSSLPIANLQARQRSLQARTREEAERAAKAESDALQSEARYRLLADQMNDTIVSLDLTGVFTFVSHSVAELTGYVETDLLGRTARRFLTPDDYGRVRRAYADLLSRPAGAGAPMEFQFRRKDGEWIWLQVNPQVARDTEGRLVGFIDVARDVTERRAMEDELERARAEAEAAARAKAEFLANMSHELRTPLTSILGFTGIAANQLGTPELVQSCIERVSNAGQALLSTVNDILDFSKLEAGQVQITPAPCDVVELCRTTLDLFEPQAGAKELALRFEQAGAGAPLLVDGARIRQILLNLIGNAVKFTTEGSVSLRLTYEGGRLRLEVVDTGAGIAADKLHLLFQRFSQIDGSLSRAHTGTGLGLAICKGLVEAMGGEIGADSQPGRGSRFWMWIPAAVAHALPQGPEQSAVAFDQDGLRVLVADDHPANRELARLFLNSLGAEVSEADDGDVAAQLAAEWPYDVILMDMRMPRMDGLSALRLIRSSAGPNDATPVIAYTADANREETIRLTGLGFNAVVSKPIELEALVSAIATALQGDSGAEMKVAHGG